MAGPALGQEPDAVRFDWAPEIVVSESYQDNIFATRNDRIDDLVTVVAPALGLEGKGRGFGFDVEAGAEISRYAENATEDYEDFNVGGDIRYDLAPGSSIFGGVAYRRDHEERDSPDDVNGAEPTVYDDVQTHVGTAFRLESFLFRIGGTHQALDFDDVAAGVGVINNDDRDRDLSTAGGRIGYQLTTAYELFVQGAYDRRAYDDPIDDLGLDRDSAGYNAAVGLRYRPSRRIDVEALVGYMHQDYDDANLETIGTWDAGANLGWGLAPNTRLDAFFSRSIEETTTPASGYVNTGLGASVGHLLRPDLSVDAGFAYYLSDYHGDGRQDDVLAVSVGGKWHVTPNFFLGADYRLTQRDSSDPDESYDDNRVMVRAGAQLRPGYDVADLAGLPRALDGFYVGAQAIASHLGTELEGDRGQPGGGGSLTSDFGFHGAGAGVFAGYGALFRPGYVGIEFSIEDSQARWTHVRAPGGRDFVVNKEASLGVGPIAGYRLDGGMAYASFAGVLTRFDTEYTEGGNDFGDETWQPGLRVGGGVEAPVGEGMFIRLDYGYTAYADYDIVSNAGRRDNFANTESQIRAGLGYRFGGGRMADPVDGSAGHDFGGPYAGFSLGFGGLDVELAGPRQAGSHLTAQFGNDGSSGGLYAGYGVTHGRVFGGIEAEAEIAGTTFNLERRATGRQVEAEKRGAFGVGVRLGYLVNEAALVYGRAGAVATEFETDYAVGDNDIRQKDQVAGFRFGGGIELPATDHLFVRADYTYTLYDSYTVDLGAARTDRFEPTESLFRVGIGYRF